MPQFGPGARVQVLITRPQPQAAQTAARLTARGHDVLLAPLLTTVALDWQLPELMPEALAFTSTAAVWLAGTQLAALRHFPVFAVGNATAAAARKMGFRQVIGSSESPKMDVSTAAALFAWISGSGFSHVLYLAARDRTAGELPPNVELRVVYAADLVAALPGPALMALSGATPPLTLLYSVRTAAHFAALADAAGLDRRTLRLAALSPPVLAAAGPGWQSGIAAPAPNETALLAAAGL